MLSSFAHCQKALLLPRLSHLRIMSMTCISMTLMVTPLTHPPSCLMLLTSQMRRAWSSTSRSIRSGETAQCESLLGNKSVLCAPQGPTWQRPTQPLLGDSTSGRRSQCHAPSQRRRQVRNGLSGPQRARSRSISTLSSTHSRRSSCQRTPDASRPSGSSTPSQVHPRVRWTSGARELQWAGTLNGTRFTFGRPSPPPRAPSKYA
mmetsp:Transcript_12282/g.36711  ORF Transcript_12282/g.36711 Transcript_12282/m.36711 type:complete len:204 (-) Transcript_12282:313-924(-)